MKPGILVSTPDLRPSLMSILKGLDEASLLQGVVTTLAIDPKRIFGKCIRAISDMFPLHWRKGIDRRTLPEFLRGRVQALYSRELIRLLASKFASDIFAHHVWLWSELKFDKEVAKQYSGRFRCIYGMEHSSLETFTRQKDLGGLCILRQVMAHAHKVVDVIKCEVDKFPEYITPYIRLFPEDMERSVARKEAEYRLADLIVANSRFVRDSFVKEGVNPEKIIYVPTGCPRCSNIPANSGQGSRPLVFLFVGMLSLRKGLPYLIKAWQLLKPGKTAELWLVGRKQLPDSVFSGQADNICYFGILSKSELTKIYEQADVFVLPTLLEGLAHTLLEALSYGLPIITTEESGCGELVQNGRNGFIIEASSVQALYDAMSWCLKNRNQLPGMGKESLEQTRAWTVADSNYQHLITIQNFLKKNELS